MLHTHGLNREVRSAYREEKDFFQRAHQGWFHFLRSLGVVWFIWFQGSWKGEIMLTDDRRCFREFQVMIVKRHTAWVSCLLRVLPHLDPLGMLFRVKGASGLFGPMWRQESHSEELVRASGSFRSENTTGTKSAKRFCPVTERKDSPAEGVLFGPLHVNAVWTHYHPKGNMQTDWEQIIRRSRRWSTLKQRVFICISISVLREANYRREKTFMSKVEDVAQR